MRSATPTVDNSFTAPGIPPGNIGHRLDGWPNRDLNVGAIVGAVAGLDAGHDGCWESTGRRS